MADEVIPLFPMVDRPSRREPPVEEPETVAEAIGAVLREERTEQGRTLADVADAASVSLPYLSEVERGRKEPSSAIIGAVADALELPLADVLERGARRLRVVAEPTVERTVGTPSRAVPPSTTAPTTARMHLLAA